MEGRKKKNEVGRGTMDERRSHKDMGLPGSMKSLPGCWSSVVGDRPGAPHVRRFGVTNDSEQNDSGTAILKCGWMFLQDWIYI